MVSILIFAAATFSGITRRSQLILPDRTTISESSPQVKSVNSPLVVSGSGVFNAVPVP